MSGANDLLRLALAAVWSSPQRPFIARADRVHRIPKLGGDPGVRSVFQHPHPLAVPNLPSDLASELKVVPLVINRPGLIGLHVDSILGRGNKLFQTQRLLSRQNADVSHTNHGQPVPAFSAHRSPGSPGPNVIRHFSRPHISRDPSISIN